jgi:hypothetical protein
LALGCIVPDRIFALAIGLVVAFGRYTGLTAGFCLPLLVVVRFALVAGRLTRFDLVGCLLTVLAACLARITLAGGRLPVALASRQSVKEGKTSMAIQNNDKIL